jgi:Flp pilus assembly protein TadG
MRRGSPGRRGQATVEFALVGVVFFVMFFGIFEVARLTYGAVAVGNAAREGARWAVASANRPSPTTTACDATLPGLQAAAVSQLQGITSTPVITAKEDPLSPPSWCQITVTWKYSPVTGGLTRLPSVTIVTTSRQYYN